MDEKILTIEIPKEEVIEIQKYDIERCAHRDIILYVMENNLNIPEERLERYQKEYNEKYFSFEKAKTNLENKYIKPLIQNKNYNWSLDYSNHIVTITLI